MTKRVCLEIPKGPEDVYQKEVKTVQRAKEKGQEE
jgi:hypothetical protein